MGSYEASNYEQLVKALRGLANGIWKNIEYTWFGGEEKVFADAAAAIEALQAQLPKRGEMVDVVRCKDCDSWDTEHSSGRKSLGNYVCICQEWSDGEDARWVCTGEDEFCSRGERRAKMEVQE